MLVVFFVLYQQLENHVLQPLVYGRTVQLSPLIVLIAVLMGAELAGVIGALGAIPVAGSIQVIVVDWLDHRRQKILDPPGPLPLGDRPALLSDATRVTGGAWASRATASSSRTRTLARCSRGASSPGSRNGMAALALVLLVRGTGAGYGEAGLVAAAYAVAVAIGAPYGGRQVDRRGAGRVLLRPDGALPGAVRPRRSSSAARRRRSPRSPLRRPRPG